MSILVATDFSENSHSAIQFAGVVAKQLTVPVRLVHVVDFAGDDNAWRVLYETPDEIEKHATQEAKIQLKQLAEKLLPGLEVETKVRFGTPSEGILAEAKDDRPEMIIAGTVGQSHLQHIFFGRTSNELVRETDVPVLAIPPKADAAVFKRILVAVDFTDCSRKAIQTAASLANSFDATIEVVHAVDVQANDVFAIGSFLGDVGPRIDELLEERDETMKEWVTGLGLDDAVSEYHIKGLRPDIGILDQCRDSGCDLIVMGTHGRRGFARWFLGSTAERVLRRAETPVLVLSSPESA